MDLSDVALFVRVVEHGGFTQAARVLGVPKSTVSRRFVRLEQALGVRLLQRTSRRQTLTEAGRAYYERVRGSVAAIETATADVARLSDEPRGHLRVAGLPELGGEPFPDLVMEFAKLHPRITVELHLSPTRIDLVAEGFDVAIRAGKLDDSGLVARKLLDTELRFYASPAYLDARGRPRRFADLDRHDHLGLSQYRAITLTGPRGRVRYRPTCRVLSNDMPMLRRGALAGLGIALLPSMICEDDVTARRLEPVLPQLGVPGAPISLVYPSGRQLDAKVRAFRDFLVARMRGGARPVSGR